MAESLSFGRSHIRHFAVDDDENHVINIDTTDTGILARWNQVEKGLSETLAEIETLRDTPGETDNEKATNMSVRFAEIDDKAKAQIDFLFNTNVSEHICAKYGSLIRTVDGEPFLLMVIERLIGYYEEDIKKDMEKSRKRIEKHTKKYVK